MFRIFRHLPPFGGINASRSFVFKNIQTSFSKKPGEDVIFHSDFPVSNSKSFRMRSSARCARNSFGSALTKSTRGVAMAIRNCRSSRRRFQGGAGQNFDRKKRGAALLRFRSGSYAQKRNKKRRRWTGYDSLSTVTFAEAVMSRKTLMVTLYSPSTLMGSASCTWRLSTLKPCAARPSAMSAVVTEPKS